MSITQMPEYRPIRVKIIHRADKVSEKGVSALCYKKPRAINLRSATWTFVDRLVTCPKCKGLIKEW